MIWVLNCTAGVLFCSFLTRASSRIAERKRRLALSCHLKTCWRKDIGERCSRGRSANSCTLTSISSASIQSLIEHILSVRRTSTGLGSGPATSARIRSRRRMRASSVSGSLAATVFISVHWPFLPMSEAWETTSGADSRNALRSSFLALLSLSSALSERILSSPSLSFTSFGSLGSTLFPPLAFVLMATASEQICSGEDLRRLLKLLQEGRAPLEAVPLLSPRGLLLFPLETFEFVYLGGELAEGPAAPVFLSHALPFAHRAVVVRAAAAFFPTHQNLEAPLQKRGGRRDVAQHEVARTFSPPSGSLGALTARPTLPVRQHTSRPERSAPCPSRAAPAGPAPERAAAAAARRVRGSTRGPARTPQRQRL